jgi:hypothetical protein
MKRLCDVLTDAKVFQGLKPEVFGEFCSKLNMRILWKGEVMVNEGDDCTQLGIVAAGQLALQKYSSNGDFVTLGLLGPGDSFGEDLIFGSNHVYPNTIEAVTNAKVITLSKEVLKSMLPGNPDLLQNFMRFLSDRVQAQNRRISILSQRSLRKKISAYLLDLLWEQEKKEAEEHGKSDSEKYGGIESAKAGHAVGNHGKRILTPSVELPSSKEVAARLLAMPRPSFSRELVSMEKDGLIKTNGRVIWLTNLDNLESGLEDDEDDFDD